MFTRSLRHYLWFWSSRERASEQAKKRLNRIQKRRTHKNVVKLRAEFSGIFGLLLFCCCCCCCCSYWKALALHSMHCTATTIILRHIQWSTKSHDTMPENVYFHDSAIDLPLMHTIEYEPKRVWLLPHLLRSLTRSLSFALSASLVEALKNIILMNIKSILVQSSDQTRWRIQSEIVT